MEKYYLVQRIGNDEYNVFEGTEQECNIELDELVIKYNHDRKDFYLSINRHN